MRPSPSRISYPEVLKVTFETEDGGEDEVFVCTACVRGVGSWSRTLLVFRAPAATCSRCGRAGPAA